MPASFAPAVKPEHMATTRTASSAAFGGASRPAGDGAAFASDARNAAPAPSAPVPSAPAPAPAAASFPVSPAPAPAPVSGADDQAASQPKPADTGTSEQQDKQNQQDKDQSGHDMFPSLFPQMADKVSVDIPDLSFPSLYGNDDASKKHAQ